MQFLEKTMENVREHKDIKLARTDRKNNFLLSKPNYHTTKQFSENLFAIEIKRNTKVKMTVSLGLSILEISKALMYELGYNFVSPMYQRNAKLCYMNTESFIFILKLKTFLKTFQIMLKKDSIHQVMKSIGYKKE